MIDSLARIEIAAARRPGLTGVWADSRKIGSIGVGIRRWVTLHGFALNVCPDLSFFDAIVPCGIQGCVMTSIAALGHPEISLAGFAEITERVFAQVFGYARVERVDPALAAMVAPRDLRQLSRSSQSGVTMPERKHPDWIKVRAPVSAEYFRTKAILGGTQAAYGLPGSLLPEYRRVLFPSHRHHDADGRRMHAQLPLLRGGARQGASARPR